MLKGFVFRYPCLLHRLPHEACCVPRQQHLFNAGLHARDGQHERDGCRTAGRLSQWLRDASCCSMRRDRWDRNAWSHAERWEQLKHEEHQQQRQQQQQLRHPEFHVSVHKPPGFHWRSWNCPGWRVGGRRDFGASRITGIDLKCVPEMLHEYTNRITSAYAKRKVEKITCFKIYFSRQSVLNFPHYAASRHSNSS